MQEDELLHLLKQERQARLDAEQRVDALLWTNRQLMGRNRELKAALHVQRQVQCREEADWASRQPADEAQRRQQDKYQRIIENMHVGLLEVDLHDRIVYTNQSFCQMSGYEAHELIGKRASALFASRTDAALILKKKRSRLAGTTDSYELAVRNKRGEEVWWLISGAPLYSPAGEVIGSTGIHLDITRQKQLESELRVAKHTAEESVRTKETFLANMSHEIRTPMHAILSIGRQLLKTDLNDRQHFYLDTINTAADHLLTIINDILDFSRIEAGQLSLEAIGFSLPTLMHQALQVMRYRADEKGLQLILQNDPEVAPVLMGDPHRINQILLNLVGNAIKFTDRGSVRVQCLCGPVQHNRQRICLQVQDTGVGMDEQFVASLFNKFTQEDSSIARQYGGTGLGMSISKQLVELMGGTIEVESRKAVGTTVRVDLMLPIGVTNELDRADELVVDADVLRHKRILLVEDNPMNRLVVTTILQQYGADMSEAVNGLEAVEALRTSQYDLVLMDLQMPVMDGLEATRVIRQDLRTEVPIIALTANALRGEQERCLAAGMNDFLAKPFEEEELVGLIARWFNRDFNFTGPMPRPNEQPLFDLTKLESISRGNTDFVQKMLNLFCAEMPVTVVQIKDAFVAGDLDRVKYLAHRIKPTIDNLTIYSLKDDIRQIERLAGAHKDMAQLSVLISKLERVIGQIVRQIRTVDV